MHKTSILIPSILLLLPLWGGAQTWKWANSLGTPNNATTLQNIGPYTGTSVLLSGSFAANSLVLGTQTLTSSGQDDGFVAIVHENGTYDWAARFGGSGRDFVVDAATAADGSFVVAGNFNSISMNIGGTNFFNSGETDAFVAKYNADKTFAWAKKIGTADIEELGDVVVDALGNTYVSGHVLDKLTLATLFVFVRKLDAAGNLLWEQKGNMQGGFLLASALTLDDDGAVLLGGSLYGTTDFSGTTLANDTSYAAFIVKYGPSGNLLDTYLNGSIDKFTHLEADGGNVYACAEKGGFCFGWGWPLGDSKIHVLKFDAGLNTLWHKTAGGENQCQSLDLAKSLSVDTAGNVYVAGAFFSDTIQFAGLALTNPFNTVYYYPQIFVLKYAPDGTAIWGKSAGGIHTDEATGIHAIGDDKFFLIGNFESDPATFGGHSLQNTGTLDSMYVHLRPARYGRRPMGFLAFFDKDASSAQPEPVSEEVLVFPNPASDQLTLRLKSPAQAPLDLQILAADGRLLRQITFPDGQASAFRVDLTGLMPGFYFLTVRTERGVFSSRFLKN